MSELKLNKNTNKSLNSKGNYILIVAFVLYLIIAVVGIVFHENWRDEAQQWLLVRDLNVVELISVMRSEGHLLPWYLILMPFAKLGFSFRTVNIISLIFCSIAVALILFKSPFEVYKKILFIFCPPMVYFFPVISRCYVLIPLAVLLIAITYKDRHIKPVPFLLSVVLLANTHMLMWGLVAAIAIDYFIEFIKDFKKNTKLSNRKEIRAMIIAAAVLVLSLMPLIIGTSANATVGIKMATIDDVILNMFTVIVLAFPYAFEISSLSAVLILLIAVFALSEVFHLGKHFVGMLFAIFYQIFVYSFVYESCAQKVMTIFLIIFYYHYINKINPSKLKIIEKLSFGSSVPKITNALAIIMAVVAIFDSAYFIKAVEIDQNYSNSIHVAEYLRANNANDAVILCANETNATCAICAYTDDLNISFYDVKKDEYYTFATWDETVMKIATEEDVMEAIDAIPEGTDIYYVESTFNVFRNDEASLIDSLIEQGILEEVYSTEGSFYNEDFVLYRVVR